MVKRCKATMSPRTVPRLTLHDAFFPRVLKTDKGLFEKFRFFIYFLPRGQHIFQYRLITVFSISAGAVQGSHLYSICEKKKKKIKSYQKVSKTVISWLNVAKDFIRKMCSSGRDFPAQNKMKNKIKSASRSCMRVALIDHLISSSRFHNLI